MRLAPSSGFATVLPLGLLAWEPRRLRDGARELALAQWSLFPWKSSDPLAVSRCAVKAYMEHHVGAGFPRLTHREAVPFAHQNGPLAHINGNSSQADANSLKMSLTGTQGPPTSTAHHTRSAERNFVWSQAQVAELVDAHGSGPCAARRGGSSPLLGTIFP